MIRRLVVGLVAVWAAVCHADPVDANTATQAQLESVSGIGPALSETILEARGKRAFEDWQDLLGRVRGIGHGSAVRLSREGLTVNGRPYAGAAPAASRASAAASR